MGSQKFREDGELGCVLEEGVVVLLGKKMIVILYFKKWYTCNFWNFKEVEWCAHLEIPRGKSRFLSTVLKPGVAYMHIWY